MTFMVIQCEDGRASINHSVQTTVQKEKFHSSRRSYISATMYSSFTSALIPAATDCVAACTATAESFTPATVHQKKQLSPIDSLPELQILNIIPTVCTWSVSACSVFPQLTALIRM